MFTVLYMCVSKVLSHMEVIVAKINVTGLTIVQYLMFLGWLTWTLMHEKMMHLFVSLVSQTSQRSFWSLIPEILN